MAGLRGAWLMRLLPITLLAGAATGAALFCAQTASATTVDDVVWMIQNSGGRYVPAGASLSGADCSGLVSVAQALAMGQNPRRLGNTTSLLAGRWPGAIPGASQNDQFVIGVNAGHMVARVNGVNIESSVTGQPYRVGAAAASPWSGQFRLYHIDPSLLVNGQVAQPVLPGPATDVAPVLQPEPVEEAVLPLMAPEPPLPPTTEEEPLLPPPPVDLVVEPVEFIPTPDVEETSLLEAEVPPPGM